MPPSFSVHRFAGLCGLLGALLFFVGDMLFYGHFGSGANFHAEMLNTVTRASDARLYAGGLIGPVAACLCIIGFWEISQNIQPPNGVFARLTLVLFCILTIFGSAVHTLWAAKGLTLKYCYGNDHVGCHTLLHSVNNYWNLAYNLGAIPGYLAATLLFVLVILRKTNYPRWTAIFNPAVLIPFSYLAEKVPAPLGAVVVGGSANLSIALFFFVSLLTTWNFKSPHSSQGPS